VRGSSRACLEALELSGEAREPRAHVLGDGAIEAARGGASDRAVDGAGDGLPDARGLALDLVLDRRSERRPLREQRVCTLQHRGEVIAHVVERRLGAHPAGVTHGLAPAAARGPQDRGSGERGRGSSAALERSSGLPMVTK
jgi:hypothetical protein